MDNLDRLERLDEKRKIQRSRNACTACHKARARCDNGRPCSRCVRMGFGNNCTTFVGKKRGRKPIRESTEGPEFFDKEVPLTGAEFLITHEHENEIDMWGEVFEDSEFQIEETKSPQSSEGYENHSSGENIDTSFLNFISNEQDAIVPIQDVKKSIGGGAIQKPRGATPTFYLQHDLQQKKPLISSCNQTFLSMIDITSQELEGLTMSNLIAGSIMKTCFHSFLSEYMAHRHLGSQVFTFITNTILKTRTGILPTELTHTVAEDLQGNIILHRVEARVLTREESIYLGLPINSTPANERLCLSNPINPNEEIDQDCQFLQENSHDQNLEDNSEYRRNFRNVSMPQCTMES